MVQRIKGSLKRIYSMVKVILYGQMEENIMVIGTITRCMDKEFLLGQTVENTKDNTRMDSNRAKVNSYGQIKVELENTANMMACGKMVNKMEQESIQIICKEHTKAVGQMAK